MTAVLIVAAVWLVAAIAAGLVIGRAIAKADAAGGCCPLHPAAGDQ